MGLVSANDPESEMETSTLNGANGMRAHGIVPLSMNEIEMVAGGKANQTIWERLMAWAEGMLSAPPANSGGITLTIDDIVMLERVCVGAGGNFSISAGTGGGGLTVRLVGADATYSWVNIQCTQP
jgi:hypothetical protein